MRVKVMRSIHLCHGEPSGTNHDQNEDDRVQGINNSVVETIGENLQLSGEPRGNTSSTGIPMIMDPAVVDNASNRPNFHRGKQMRLSNLGNSTTYLEEAKNNPIVKLAPEMKYSKAIVNRSYLSPVTNDMNDENEHVELMNGKIIRSYLFLKIKS